MFTLLSVVTDDKLKLYMCISDHDHDN